MIDVRWLVGLGLLALAAGSASAQEDAEARLLQQISKETRPWYPFTKGWVNEATVIVKATYHRGKYPHVNEGEFRVYYFQSSFAKVVLFKGDMACPQFDLEISDPTGFVEGRSILIFLKPGPKSQKLLDDPKARFSYFTRLPRGEIIGMIDLSQGQDEHESLRVKATRSGTWQSFEFTPVQWAAFRKAKRNGLKEQLQYLAFIEKVVAVRGATLRDVRGYLGEPGYWDHDGRTISFGYGTQQAYTAVKGDFGAYFQFYFSSDLKLTRFDIHYRRSIGDQVWEEPTAEERRNLGLRDVSLEFTKPER